MPRRSNEFQQLVRLLQEQLTGGQRVEESAMLVDCLTGSEVEVDVVVTTNTGGIDLVLGFEASAGRRAKTVEWVRAMLGKHKTLAIDKTILVSKSGFTEEALARAKAENILALTLDEAIDADWQALVGGLSNLNLGAWTFRPLSGNMKFEGQHVGAAFDDKSIFRRADTKEQFTVAEYVNSLLHRPDLFERVARKWLRSPPDERPDKYEFTVNVKPEGNLEVKIGDEWTRVVEVSVKTEATMGRTPLHMKAGKLQGHNIAFGTAENIFPDKQGEYVLINLVAGEGGVAKASLLIPAHGDGATEIFHMRTPVTSPEEGPPAGRVVGDESSDHGR